MPSPSSAPGWGSGSSSSRYFSFEGPTLPGQDKWLGGTLGQDGIIYGVPGTAKTVLKIVPSTGEVTTFGGPYDGKLKWLRGITAANGAIYAIPANADAVLKIVPETQQVTTIGGPFPGKWKWHGGVLANDGNIYGIPCNAESVLKIVPSTDEVSTFGGPLEGKQKWYGGLLGNDGAIYGIPNCAAAVLRIEPQTGKVTTIGDLPLGGWKWHGGVCGDDGAIYGVPAHADSVLKIVPVTGEVKTFGGPLDSGTYRPNGKFKWGGAVLGPNRTIYCMPSDADAVLKIDLLSETASVVGRRFEGPHNKWQNGFVGPDGKIYGIPCNAEGILQISPHTDEVKLIGGPWPGTDKWEGGVVTRGGEMYCMPQRAKVVMKITPPRTAGCALPTLGILAGAVCGGCFRMCASKATAGFCGGASSRGSQLQGGCLKPRMVENALGLRRKSMHRPESGKEEAASMRRLPFFILGIAALLGRGLRGRRRGGVERRRSERL